MTDKNQWKKFELNTLNFVWMFFLYILNFLTWVFPVLEMQK